MTDVETAARATSALLDSSAVMLGAALLFVMLFRKLRLGATLGYIVAGALIGPQVLGLISDPAALRPPAHPARGVVARHSCVGSSKPFSFT